MLKKAILYFFLYKSDLKILDDISDIDTPKIVHKIIDILSETY